MRDPFKDAESLKKAAKLKQDSFLINKILALKISPVPSIKLFSLGLQRPK